VNSIPISDYLEELWTRDAIQNCFFLNFSRILSHEETNAETTRLTTACRSSRRRRAGDDDRMKGEVGPLKRSECRCAN